VHKIGAGLSKVGIAMKGGMRFIREMEVFAVTVFVSLLFGVLFAVLFVAERAQRQVGSLEQVALLPLDDTGIIQTARKDSEESHSFKSATQTVES
jgi:hypothetical protein